MKGVPKNTAIPLLTGLVRTMRDCCQRQEGMMCGKLGLTPSQFACLLAMPEKAGEFSVQEVAEVMGLSPSRTSRIVDAMVRGGLFSRRTLSSDRRTQLVALTSVGQEKWQEGHKLLAECERRLLARLPPQRKRDLAETLKMIIESW